MKKFYFTLVSLTVMTFLILQVGLAAEKIVQSGDATIDQNMKEMNAKARENLKEFSLRTGKQFGVSPEVVDELMKERKMSPADAHMALNVAKTSRRPVEEVAMSMNGERVKTGELLPERWASNPDQLNFMN